MWGLGWVTSGNGPGSIGPVLLATFVETILNVWDIPCFHSSLGFISCPIIAPIDIINKGENAPLVNLIDARSTSLNERRFSVHLSSQAIK